MTKTCTKCHKTKNLDQFYTDLRYTDEHTPNCRQCTLKRSATWHKTPKGQASAKRRHAKYKAKQRQLKLDDWLAAKF